MSNESISQSGEPSKESACSNAAELKGFPWRTVLLRCVAPGAAVAVTMLYLIAWTFSHNAWWVWPTLMIEGVMLGSAVVWVAVILWISIETDMEVSSIKGR